jgi:hypothetical protein
VVDDLLSDEPLSNEPHPAESLDSLNYASAVDQAWTATATRKRRTRLV